jgi:hypothetical protein
MIGRPKAKDIRYRARPDFNWDKKQRATSDEKKGHAAARWSRPLRVQIAGRRSTGRRATTNPWPCPAATLVGVEFDVSLCSRQFYFIWLECRSSRPVVLSSVTPGERPGRTANHGQGGLAANLGRHHHLRRLGCYRHNRQRLALGLDADGSVSTLDRIHQPL